MVRVKSLTADALVDGRQVVSLVTADDHDPTKDASWFFYGKVTTQLTVRDDGYLSLSLTVQPSKGSAAA